MEGKLSFSDFFASGERQWRTGAAAVSFYQLDGHLQQVAAAVG